MDLNRLRSEVFEKTGIKIDTGDPIFALVALNEAVLSECIVPHIEKLDRASEALQAQTRLLIVAGDRYKHLLEQTGKQVDDPQAETLKAAVSTEPAPVSSHVWPTQSWRFALIIALVSALLTLAGQALLRPGMKAEVAPAIAAPAPATAAPTLSEEQRKMIAEGEKFARVWPKLDTKTQAKITAILDQSK